MKYLFLFCFCLVFSCNASIATCDNSFQIEKSISSTQTTNPVSGIICNITHESGTFSDYDYISIDKGTDKNDVKGELVVEKAAALGRTGYGLRVVQGIGISSSKELRTSAIKKLPRSDTGFYRIRFYFDTYTLNKDTQSISELSRLIVLMPRSDPLFWLIFALELKDGQFALKFGFRQDDWKTTKNYIAIDHNISPGKHLVELRYKKASGKGVADGMAELFIDGISVGSNNKVMRFDNFELDRVEVGAYWSMNTLNSYLIDEILIRNDDTPIGAVA